MDGCGWSILGGTKRDKVTGYDGTKRDRRDNPRRDKTGHSPFRGCPELSRYRGGTFFVPSAPNQGDTDMIWLYLWLALIAGAAALVGLLAVRFLGLPRRENRWDRNERD